ncbi:hypothetical protein C1646_663493 [Rhizophagus diaphanus]|nr:hypothetical protein C1646_663493 [Rhizophagus diaphanus] [Rhizophagus sp. MUCL 43196]
MPEGRLTDEEIVDTVLNANKKEENVDKIGLFTLEKINLAETKKSINETIRFLYEQGLEFSEVGEELKVLRRLYKQFSIQLKYYITNLPYTELNPLKWRNCPKLEKEKEII